MDTLLKTGLTFACGVACTAGMIALLGADKPPVSPARQLDTEVVPVAGGLALILTINDRDNNRLYVYKFPTKKENAITLSGSIDLSKTGQEQLPADLKLD